MNRAEDGDVLIGVAVNEPVQAEREIAEGGDAAPRQPVGRGQHIGIGVRRRGGEAERAQRLVGDIEAPLAIEAQIARHIDPAVRRPRAIGGVGLAQADIVGVAAPELAMEIVAAPVRLPAPADLRGLEKRGLRRRRGIERIAVLPDVFLDIGLDDDVAEAKSDRIEGVFLGRRKLAHRRRRRNRGHRRPGTHLRAPLRCGRRVGIGRAALLAQPLRMAIGLQRRQGGAIGFGSHRDGDGLFRRRRIGSRALCAFVGRIGGGRNVAAQQRRISLLRPGPRAKRDHAQRDQRAGVVTIWGRPRGHEGSSPARRRRYGASTPGIRGLWLTGN